MDHCHGLGPGRARPTTGRPPTLNGPTTALNGRVSRLLIRQLIQLIAEVLKITVLTASTWTGERGEPPVRLLDGGWQQQELSLTDVM